MILCMQAPSIDWKEAQKGRFGPSGYLGVASVPLPDQRQSESKAEAERREALAERRRREDLVQVCPSSFCLISSGPSHGIGVHRM